MIQQNMTSAPGQETLLNESIHLYDSVIFHQLFANILNIANINDIIAGRGIIQIFLIHSFFMLSTVNYFEIFPKHNGHYFISES